MDLQLVHSTLELKYHVEDTNEVTLEPDIHNSLEHEDIWNVLDGNERTHNTTSSFSLEIEHYLKYPRARKEADPLQWWYQKRYYSSCLLVFYVYVVDSFNDLQFTTFS